MSTLQVSNVHLESTANNRIEYGGSNTVNIYAGGTNVLSANSSGLQVSNVHLESTANNRIEYGGSNTVNIYVGGTKVIDSNSSTFAITENVQVSNVHLESTANNRIEYGGSNTVNIYAGGNNVLSANSFGLNFTGNLYQDGISYVGGGGAYINSTGGEISNTNLSHIFRIHSDVVSANVTIAANNNAIACGPLIVDNNVVLEIAGELSII